MSGIRGFAAAAAAAVFTPGMPANYSRECSAGLTDSIWSNSGGSWRIPSGPVMKTCQPSSARARPLAIATTTLNRTVVVASPDLDACTMKVTATPLCAMLSPDVALRQIPFQHRNHARRRIVAVLNPVASRLEPGSDRQARDCEPASKDNPLRKSSRACFPADCAAW
jgi:hypothetical protein